MSKISQFYEVFYGKPLQYFFKKNELSYSQMLCSPRSSTMFKNILKMFKKREKRFCKENMGVMRHKFALSTLTNAQQESALYNETALIYWHGNVLFQILSG